MGTSGRILYVDSDSTGREYDAKLNRRYSFP